MDSEISISYIPHADSPRYARYAARLQNLKSILETLRRHRLLIAFLTLAVLGLLAGLLSYTGTFTTPLTCTDFVYGETPAAQVQAFWAEVRYEFAPVDSDAAWSSQTPTAPGSYRIRAVSQNGFGTPRYSNSVQVRILPRDLNVTLSDTRFIYGAPVREHLQAATSVTGLAPGDRIAALEYDSQADETAFGHYAVAPTSIRVENADGLDVTACYRISTTGAAMIIDPRPLDISAQSAEKTYDGQPWDHTAGTAAVTGGNLAPGDTLEATFESMAEHVDAGVYPIPYSYGIRNAAGEDVTAFYAITAHEATLNIRQRRIYITTGSAEKQYDGAPLVCSEWRMTDGTLLEEHTLAGTVTGTRTTTGTSKNSIDLAVYDEAGLDVTHNYIFVITQGELKVIPIRLVFETGSAEKVFDGTELRNDQWQLVQGETLPGHNLTAKVTGSLLYATTLRNTLAVTITDRRGRNVTNEGYEIVINYGTLTVTPRPITVTSRSAEKLYDGYPLTAQNFDLTEGSLGAINGYTPYFNTSFTGSQTAVGSSPSYFSVRIYNSLTNGDITYCYDITYEYGTLKVLDNPNYKDPTESNKETGIGSHNTPTKLNFPTPSGTVYATVKGIKGFSKSTQVYFRDTSYGNYNGSGWDAAAPDTNSYSGKKNLALVFIGRSLSYTSARSSEIYIERMSYCPTLLPYYANNYYATGASGNDCCLEDGHQSYVLTMYTDYSYEDLQNMTVSKYETDMEKIYRALVHRRYTVIPESTKEALLAWAEEQGIWADSSTLVQDIQNAVRNGAIYNLNADPYPEGVDVAVYFLTEAKEGICQHFATAATLLYRAFGIPARYTVGFVGYVQNGTTTKLTDYNAHAWVEIYVDGLGWVPMEVTGSGFVEGDPSQGGSIIKPSLVLKAFSGEKYYDGQPFAESDLAQYYIVSGQLAEGHRMEVTVSYDKNVTTPGDYINKITRCKIYDENGKDITSTYYDLVLMPGTLTIHRRPITVTFGSATKIYDGQPLQCTDYWISAGSLLPGHALHVEIPESITEPGTLVVYPETLRVLDINGADIRYADEYYEVLVTPATLTVHSP